MDIPRPANFIENFQASSPFCGGACLQRKYTYTANKSGIQVIVRLNVELVTEKVPFLSIVWFQKISMPPPRRELEIPEGWGGQWPRKFQRGEGVNGWISFQRVNFTFMSEIIVQNCNLPT